MIRIAAEANSQALVYRSAMRRSATLDDATDQLRRLQQMENNEAVKQALDQILRGVDSIRNVDLLRNNLNQQDLCFAIDTLCTSFTKLNIDPGSYNKYGIGEEGKAPIPIWKCKEWKCLYENADKKDRVEDTLRKIYNGGKALKSAINGGNLSQSVSISAVNNDIAAAIIGDKTNKNNKPFGAKGKYETYVQFITSELPFDGDGEVVFSEIPSPNDQMMKKNEENQQQESVLEGMSSLVTLDKGKPRTDKQLYAFFAFEPEQGCTCTYLNNGEVLVIFNNEKVEVIKDIETLYQLVKPSTADWHKLKVRDKGTSGSFVVECQLRESKDQGICDSIRKHIAARSKTYSVNAPSKPINEARQEPPPDVKTATEVRVEVKNGSGGSKFCIKFSLPKKVDIPESDWTDYADVADESYEVLE